MHVIIYLSKPTEHTTLESEPYVNYGLSLITRHRCWFIDCNKCTTLMWDNVDGRGCGRDWGGDGRAVWELSVLSDQFFCQSKTSLKFKM